MSQEPEARPRNKLAADADARADAARGRLTTTKREARLHAREDRKRRAAAAQRAARVRQVVLLAILGVVLVGVVIAAIATGLFGLLSTPVGRAMPIEGADHVPETTQVVYQSRPPTSGAHFSAVYPRYGVFNETISPGLWLHNLEHGAVAILYNCPTACPELEAQLKELYPTLPLGRNARRGSPRVLVFPYQDMDHKIAVVSWGWMLELDEFDRERIVKFYDSRLDRGPECVNLACPEM